METTDDSLVLEIQGGCADAFDALMRRYERLVCKVAMNYVKQRDNALDVTQNVFVKVYGNIHKVQPGGMFKPWLLRITYNESISYIRKQRPQEVDAVEDGDPATAVDAGQERGVLKREAQSQVLKGIEELNPKYKLAVSLRYSEGLRVREIADVMGCSEGMVKSLLFRGIRQIRKHVESAPGLS